MRINLYAQNRHMVILDGIPLQGFAEGDFMTVKQDGNAAEITKGGDGPAMSISTAQGGQIGLHLNPTSPVIGTIYAIRETQQSDPRLFSIQLMTGVEETICASGCAFADLPQIASGGPTMQPRQFEIKALKIKMDASAVEAIAGSFV